MSEAFRALLLSLGAGLSTMIGALIVLLTRKKSERLITLSLGFAAGVMLSVSFADLFPNATHLLSGTLGRRGGTVVSVLALLIGILLAAAMDHFVPHEEYSKESGEAPHKNLLRVGMVSMLAIGLHNFPEGMATFMAGFGDITLGVSIAVAIALHNIPEGIAVAMPIFFATGDKKKAVFYTFLSGIAEPIGALVAFLVLRPFMSNVLLGGIFSAVAGIMIYICVEELIPSSRQYGHNREALIATFTGICLMPLTHIL